MSILGAVLRTHPSHLDPVLARLHSLPGVDVAVNPGDGRLVLVLEDVQDASGQIISAAAALADMAMWPDVLSTSLVYEYSGPDAPALGERDMSDYRLWRGRPGSGDRDTAAPPSDSRPLAAVTSQSSISPIANTPDQAQPLPAATKREETP